jgi:hypothetical protein
MRLSAIFLFIQDPWGGIISADVLTIFSIPLFYLNMCKFCIFKKLVKGIVQRDITGVETRLKRSVLMN